MGADRIRELEEKISRLRAELEELEAELEKVKEANRQGDIDDRGN